MGRAEPVSGSHKPRAAPSQQRSPRAALAAAGDTAAACKSETEETEGEFKKNL